MSDKHEIILLQISGEDKPGITAAVTAILAEYDANILDIGQADIHNTLSLGILFEVSKGNESAPILKDLLFAAYEMGLKAKFKPISYEKYEKWVSLQGKNRYIITILGKKLTAAQIATVTKVFTDEGLNIDNITRLTGRIPIDQTNNQSRSSVQMSVRGTVKNKADLQMKFINISQSLGIDIGFQEDNMYRRNRRLVCFDMDSTLIQTEVIDELAHRNGVGEEVSAITRRAMSGEIDFNESFIQRVALLKGLDESVLEDVAKHLPITDGAERLISTLKAFGYKTAILSGGFTYFGNYLRNKLGVDYVYANELEIKDGKLTGKHLGEIVDGKRKAELLKLLTQVENLHINQVIAVGDGANDLPMLNLAGLGIAFHAKPIVKENAQHSISTIGLDGILYLLGFNDSFLDDI
ncbi:MAG: phosphoserine phosphatase SerB [Bacteroidales bacterium]|jgi:phosphoserine phosphatase|nr:phosphoserine phosphatase SerB [Bacteroidales bacterium]